MSATGEVSGSARRGRRVILWRHGQTSWNVERRFQGSTDVDLTETDRGPVGHYPMFTAPGELATLLAAISTAPE